MPRSSSKPPGSPFDALGGDFCEWPKTAYSELAHVKNTNEINRAKTIFMFLFKRDLLLIDHFIISSVWSECDAQGGGISVLANIATKPRSLKDSQSFLCVT